MVLLLLHCAAAHDFGFWKAEVVCVGHGQNVHFRYRELRKMARAGCHWTSDEKAIDATDASIDATDLQLIHCTHHRTY